MKNAIIVDIDGTLSLHSSGRGPFDWHRVSEDSLNHPIARIVERFFDDHEIIIFSGRDSVCRADTESWLYKHEIPFDSLYMRPQGNMEKDCIIKRRLFDEHVKDKFNVLFVLDDRNQVVEMWRELGLTCLQVAPGDF